MAALADRAAYSSGQSKTAHPKKVVIMGDSLIYGYGDTEGGGWVERLRRQWIDPSQPGPIVYNLGVRGDGVQQVATRLEGEFKLRGELRRRVPDILVLSVGLNDCARLGRPTGRPMTDEITFTRELSGLLEQAKQLCPTFFVGMVPVNETSMPYADVLHFSNIDQAHYNQMIRHACEARQIPYLDLYQQWCSQGQAWCHERLCDDGLHPNVLGYRTLVADISGWQPLMQTLV
ncbi:lysophospholipase l1-like esterase [Leptolyngbya sp. Heron Island J]|uniref:GDSL-type esterase/lipase family protein n=1 Tax=Leptolyngbya sp. Heron Island J TaxID=1385935 RepID=UPI0003B9A610|nr:GDSL-type esterase/lipase family protein [Leptolyngbya sp. Heron Island J]ESA37640.1 lysophospholipase l1-like esterase [Leptolyngbya sp. Heron Island J]